MREDIIVKAIEMLGTYAFAISGIRHAAAKHFDWFGGYVCGIAVAIGGGTIRDVMLGITPFWMTTPIYIICTAVALFTVAFFGRWMEPLKNAWFVFDTFGLALFTIAGIQKSLVSGQPFWVAIIMGCITGSAGGVIRDVLLNNEPVIFRKEIYAMACVIGGLVYWAGSVVGLPVGVTAMVSFVTTCLIRFLAVRYHLSLPILKGEGQKRQATMLLLALATAATAMASGHKAVRQRFHKELPPGNYSGICPIGGGLYAVVSDKAETDGFFIFRIETDSIKGRISSVWNLGYRSSGLSGRDMEAICYCPSSNTLFISGEADNEVYEYSLDGWRTGRRLAMPPAYAHANKNLGLESLTYDDRHHLFFTTTERPLPGDTMLRIQSFGDDLLPRQQYLYQPDAPISRKYYHGVSEICALRDGRLLVVERQLRVPRMKIGARAVTRLYEVTPISTSGGSRREDAIILQKKLVKEIKTHINLFSRSFANYEALCQTDQGLLILMADSQNRYRGILRDWFLTIKGL